MATKTRRRKTNTAMVFNPNRGLSIGGRSTVRRSAKRNPVRKKRALVANSRHKRRRVSRRRNPITNVSQLLVTAFMAGIGVSIADVVIQKVMPQQSAIVRIGGKAGVAWLINNYGQKIPVLGNYKTEIALVLLVSAVMDASKLWVLPIVSQAVGNLTGNALNLVQLPATAADDSSLAGVYPRQAYAY